MRYAIIAIVMTAFVAGNAFAQTPANKPRPNGQSGSTCVADCAKELAKCREPGKTNGTPPNCAPDYNACVKNCK
jgi:hypothetical protein